MNLVPEVYQPAILSPSLEKTFREYITLEVDTQHSDPSHDVAHVERVVYWARKMAISSAAKLEVVIPAAYLHDCVYISKTDPRRSQASRLSADRAVELLGQWKYPAEFFNSIHHAISAHSFSAKIPAESLEAKIVQDADRLDALGAVGIMRAYTMGGIKSRPLFSMTDTFCKNRPPNDQHNTLDHFYTKLLGLADTLHTPMAREEGRRRLKIMDHFLEALQYELNG